MAKYIAHSSIDERGKISGGKAGDQTGKEVCIRTMYYKPWNIVIRILDEKVRIQFGNNMIDIANNPNVGYDQGGRNSLLIEAEKVNFDFTKITTPCEGDCSSTVTTALLGAIYTILGQQKYLEAKKILFKGNNCATTSTIRSRMTSLTMISVKVYTTSSYTASILNALFGDIYNKEGSHIVAYIDDGRKVSVSGVVTNSSSTVATSTTSTCNYLMKGDEGSEVKVMQEHLIYLGYSCGKYGADGDFGDDSDKALRAFQRDYSLTVDGKYGKKSKVKLEQLVLAKKNNCIKTTVTYLTHRIPDNKWGNEIVGYNLTNSMGYSGSFGKEIDKVTIKLSQGTITYCAHRTDGKWGGEIHGYNTTDTNYYAGSTNKPIDAIIIKATGINGKLKYRVHRKTDNKWGNWITGYSKTDTNNYAGSFGKPIDAIQIGIE